MKRPARFAALSIALFGAVLISAPLQAKTASYTGVIHSNQCVGPACATQCPIDKDPVYTLQTEDRAWVLNNPQVAARYAGKRVIVLGTVQGNKLKVTSLKPAE